MAEVHSVAFRISAEGAHRLSASVAAIARGGGAPASRAPQIRSLGLSLEPLVEALRSEVLRIGNPERLGSLMVEVERIAHVARWARAYSGDQSE